VAEMSNGGRISFSFFFPNKYRHDVQKLHGGQLVGPLLLAQKAIDLRFIAFTL
jgi:hypothetical protein